MANMELKAVISAEDKASSTISKVGGAFTTLAKVGIAGAVAGVAALTAGLYASAKAFSESEDIMAQTNAVLTSTKGIAGVTATEVSKLSASLQKVTKFSDETIQSGENLLLTFTGIGKDIFPQATETMLNMSQALGQDVKSSAIQLGKALQDPILGVTALRRVGVNFNDEAKKTIENLVNTGQSAKAQAFILKELETEFGNSARAAGETFSGKLIILNNQFDDMKETIGKVLVEALIPLVTAMSNWAANVDIETKIQNLVGWFQMVRDKIVEFFTQTQLGQTILFTFQGLLNMLVEQARRLWQIILDNKEMFKEYGQGLLFLIGGAIALFMAALIAITWTIGKVIQAMAWLRDASNSLKATLVETFTHPLQAIKNYFNTIINGYNKVIGGLNKFTGAHIPTIPSFQQGGIMPYEGLAYLHKGERIIPNSTTNNSNAMNVNIYGNINNSNGLSPSEIAGVINRQVELSRMGAY